MGWAQLKKAYNEFNDRVVREILGPVGVRLAPLALGKQFFTDLDRDLKAEMVERIAVAHSMHKVIERYIAISADIFRSNRDAMQRMPPSEFEKLLHPVFQEDEWILILLGGVLGAVVGIAQVHFLST